MELVGKKMIDEFDDVYRLKNLWGANAGNVLGGGKNPTHFRAIAGTRGAEVTAFTIFSQKTSSKIVFRPGLTLSS